MKAPAPLAYSYVRFSHPDQAKGDSLRRQTELRDAWLARNGVRLDTSLTLEDKGVSGYTGYHRENPDRHALAAFVALVKQGRIPTESYLVVEALDRLSREDILPALSLLLDLIQSGIRVVQLLPVEVVYDRNANPMQLMMAIMELSRGHSESAMKSERVGGAWREKKRRAAENGEPLTARAPAWLRLVDGRWEIDRPAAEAIRRIYALATAGYGLTSITKRLNSERFPTFGKADHWGASYIAKLLTTRAVIGELQPHRGRGAKRQHDGEPIANYYPSIITEDQWYAARAGLAARRGKPGRLPVGCVNIFAGLLHDASNGGPVHIADKGKRGGRQLVSYRAEQGVTGAGSPSFPFGSFEAAILSCLREIDPSAILPKRDTGAGRDIVIAGRLAELDGEIEQVKDRLQARYSDAVADVLERHEAERKSLVEHLSDARQEAASPLGEAWGEARSLTDVLRDAADPDEARVRLRAALRRIVEGAWCLFLARAPYRLAAVQIRFTGGGVRNYTVADPVLPAVQYDG